jgi:AraC family transcriptional regulator
MLFLSDYPVIDYARSETKSFLDIWNNKDNVFRSRTKKISDSGNQGNFSIKTSFGGSILYVVDGCEKIIEPGTFLVINKGTSYACYIDSTVTVEDVCVQITSETLNDVFRSLIVSNKELLNFPFGSQGLNLNLETISFVDAGLHCVLKKMANRDLEDLRRDEYKTTLINHYFQNLYLKHFIQLNSIKNESISTKMEILKRVHQAKDFLHSNYSKSINLQQMAVAACISPSHLIRKFNEVFGVTPYQYLRNLRLKKAIDILKNSEVSVENLTTMLGFESPSSFIRVFRETYKTTPNSLRRQYKCYSKTENDFITLT